MKLGGSARERKTMLLVGLLGILILWVYGTYILAPIGRSSRELREEARNAKDELGAAEAMIAREPELRRERERIEANVGTMREMMPPEERLPYVIERLSDLAEQAQVKIQTIFPHRPVELEAGAAAGQSGKSPTSPYYKEVLIQIDAVGGYHQLGQFISAFESAEAPVRIATLRISPHQKELRRHAIKLLLRSYLTTSGAAGAGGSP